MVTVATRRPLSVWLTAVAPRGERGQEVLWGLLHKGTNPLHEGSTLMASSLPKALLPNTMPFAS